jgi:glycosyltransferase involved in cell wall biosynthesis
VKVTGFVRDNGACGFYRVTQPLTFLKKHGVDTNFIEKGDKAFDISHRISTSDLFVIPRPSENEILDFFPTARAYGKKIVVEHDDDLLHVSPLSQHYNEWGTEEFAIEMGGKKVELWKDGHTFDIAKNRKRIENVKRSIGEADALTVTTPELAKAYAEYNENIYCLPNCVDMEVWKQLPLVKNKDEVRLFWSGGASHYEDWAQIAGMLKPLFEKHKEAKLVLMGTKFDGTLKGVPEDRIEFHPWVDTRAYPYKVPTLGADIGIIPLNDTIFNRGKSAIKWIEQASLSVPCVASAFTPYIEMDEGGNGIFIENNSVDGWIEGISMLIEDKMLRWDMGMKANETVKRNFDINKEWKQWVDAYQTVLDG